MLAHFEMDFLHNLETFVKEPMNRAGNCSGTKRGGGKPRKKDKARVVGKRSKKSKYDASSRENKENNVFQVRPVSPIAKIRRMQGKITADSKITHGPVTISANRLTQKLKAGIYEQGKASNGILRRKPLGDLKSQNIDDELHRVLGLHQNITHKIHASSELQTVDKPLSAGVTLRSTRELDFCEVLSPSKEPEQSMDHGQSSEVDALRTTLDRLISSFPSAKAFGKVNYVDNIKKNLRKMLQSHSPEIYTELTDIFLVKQKKIQTEKAQITEKCSEDNQMDTFNYPVERPGSCGEIQHSPRPISRESDTCSSAIHQFHLAESGTQFNISSSPGQIVPEFDVSLSVPENNPSVLEQGGTLDFLDVVDHDQDYSLKQRHPFPSLQLPKTGIPTPPKMSPHKMF